VPVHAMLPDHYVDARLRHGRPVPGDLRHLRPLRLDQDEPKLLRLYAMRRASGTGAGAMLLQLLVLHAVQLPLPPLHCLPRDTAGPSRLLSRVVLPLLSVRMPAGVLLLLLHEMLWNVQELSAVSALPANTLPRLSKLLLLPRGLYADHADLMRPLPGDRLLRMPLPQPRRLPSLLCKVSSLLHAGQAQSRWGVAVSVRHTG
jgi:hypothetical protein